MKTLALFAFELVLRSRSVGDVLFRYAQSYVLRFLSSGIYAPNENGEARLASVLHRFDLLKEVLDVGANNGEWASMICEMAPNARVHCVEAAPTTAASLQERFRDSSNVRVYNQALSDSESANTFHYRPGRSDLSSFVSEGETHASDSQQLKISTITGRQFCSENQISSVDFIKIDCEGYDLKVIRGLGDVARNCPVIQFEHNQFGMRAGARLEDFAEALGATHLIGRLTQYGVLIDHRESQWINGILPGNHVAIRRDLNSLIGRLSRFTT